MSEIKCQHCGCMIDSANYMEHCDMYHSPTESQEYADQQAEYFGYKGDW